MKILAPLLGAFALLVPAAASAQADPKRGETVFRQRCAACHSVQPGPAKMGPPLQGVVGRRAGSQPYNYSPAMKGAKLNWTDKQLSEFLAAPGKKVPGTRMMVPLPDPADRAAVIAYLRMAR